MKKPKYNFGEHEWSEFYRTFWTNDDIQFTHPRNKVQIPFAIAIFCWTGARIGAFFPNKYNKQEAGLRYRVGLLTLWQSALLIVDRTLRLSSLAILKVGGRLSTELTNAG